MEKAKALASLAAKETDWVRQLAEGLVVERVRIRQLAEAREEPVRRSRSYLFRTELVDMHIVCRRLRY